MFSDTAITALGILCVNAAILITALVNSYLAIRAKNTTVAVATNLQTNHDIDIADQNTQLGEIHTLVNSRLTQAVEDIHTLKSKLLEANIAVPVTQTPIENVTPTPNKHEWTEKGNWP